MNSARRNLYIIPNAVEGGRPGAVIRNESGHPLQYLYGTMEEIAKLVQRRWAD